jgi:hypothetical protein
MGSGSSKLEEGNGSRKLYKWKQEVEIGHVSRNWKREVRSAIGR